MARSRQFAAAPAHPFVGFAARSLLERILSKTRRLGSPHPADHHHVADGPADCAQELWAELIDLPADCTAQDDLPAFYFRWIGGLDTRQIAESLELSPDQATRSAGGESGPYESCEKSLGIVKPTCWNRQMGHTRAVLPTAKASSFYSCFEYSQ